MSTADGTTGTPRLAFAAFLTLLVALLVGFAFTYGPTSRLVPLVIGVPTLVALGVVTLAQVWSPAARLAAQFNTTPISVESDLFEGSETVYRDRPILAAVGWVAGLSAVAFLFGFVAVIPVFVYAYLRREGGHARRRSALIAVGTTAVVSGLFELVFSTPLYAGAVPNLVLELLVG
jgi:hypothetical protein